MSLGPRIVATALLALGVTAFVVAEPPREQKHLDIRSLEHRLDASLKRAINHGARIYNNGDPSGCCRVYEGALLGLQPLLAHRPELLENVKEALDDSRQSSCVCRAFKLRKALDEVRSGLHPPMPYEREDRKGKRMESLPPTPDGKRIEEKTTRKVDERGRTIEEKTTRRVEEPGGRRTEEETTRSISKDGKTVEQKTTRKIDESGRTTEEKITRRVEEKGGRTIEEETTRKPGPSGSTVETKTTRTTETDGRTTEEKTIRTTDREGRTTEKKTIRTIDKDGKTIEEKSSDKSIEE